MRGARHPGSKIDTWAFSLSENVRDIWWRKKDRVRRGKYIKTNAKS
jgi:hypothetical protein